jgi:hypothetical protein
MTITHRRFPKRPHLTYNGTYASRCQTPVVPVVSGLLILRIVDGHADGDRMLLALRPV